MRKPGSRTPRAWEPTPKRMLVASLVILLSLAAFIPHALQAWNNDVAWWDRTFSEAVHAYENRDTVLNRFDVLGLVLHPALQLLGVGIVFVVAIALVRKGYRRLALAFVVGVVGATVLGPILKELFARPPVDPTGNGDSSSGSYSFPSGHALRSMALALALSLIAWPTKWRWPVAVGGGVAVVLIGLAVVYHEWHWASDVVGGWCVAVAWLGSVWLALRPLPIADVPARVDARRVV